MTRKMAWVGFSYMFGLFLSSVFGTFISFAAAAVLLSAAAVMILFNRKLKLPVTAVVSVICLAVGFSYYALYECKVYDRAVMCDRQTSSFTGRITDIDASSKGRTAYTLSGKLNDDIPCGVILYADNINSEIGDVLSFSGKPYKITDSYVFASENYYKSKGIYLRYYSAEDCMVTRTTFSLRRIADRYKSYILGIIDENMPETEGAMLKAMLLGEKSSLDNDVKTMLYRSGCGHIMAVSGIHMTIICNFLTSLLLTITPFGRRTVFVITMTVLGFFCVMAGLSPSAVRSYIMLIIVGMGSVFGRESDTLNSLGIAGIVLTIGSPYAAADTGLLLSIAGVIGIGVIAPEVVRRINSIRSDDRKLKDRCLTENQSSFIGSVCAYTVTFPVSMLIFDEVSVVSPITNTFLVPFCTAALLCGAVSALTGGISIIAKPMLFLASLLCKPVLAASELISGIPSLYLPVGDPAYKYVAAAVTAFVLSLMFINKDMISSCLTGIICICAVIFFCDLGRLTAPDRVYAAYVFDNSGNAVVITNGRTASVIDMGDGAYAADKYLKQKGIYDIDMIMLTDDPSVDISSYEDRFGLYNIASYFCAENSGVYMSGELSDRIYYYEPDTLYTVGYADFSADSDGGTKIYINGLVYSIPSEKISDSEAFCTFLGGRGSFDVTNSSYICTDGRGEYSSDDGVIFDNCCIEFITEEASVKERVLFVGGS